MKLVNAISPLRHLNTETLLISLDRESYVHHVQKKSNAFVFSIYLSWFSDKF